MHLTASLKKAGLVAGALLAAVLLIAVGTQRAAADDDVNLCPADRPCITELSVQRDGVLFARWSGDWDFYNIRLSTPGELVTKSDFEGHSWGWTILDGAWGRTYRFSIEGCNSNFLAPSDCTPWADREITLRAPRAPENVRLAGDSVEFGRVDPITFHVQLWGTQQADGAKVWITSSGHVDTVRSLTLPAGWRDRFSAIEVCASNPAGRNCTDVQTRIIANPQVSPKLPPAPSTPANFRGQRDGGFGTRIILSWSDTSDEEYYYLTAFSAENGQQVGPLAEPAPKLGANSTTFIVTGDFAALVGGIEFRLQACNAGGCSTPAKVVVQ